jgi:hypothetical protein
MLSVLGMDRVTQPARACHPRFDVNDFLMHNVWVTESAQPGSFIFHCSHNSSQLRPMGCTPNLLCLGARVDRSAYFGLLTS